MNSSNTSKLGNSITDNDNRKYVFLYYTESKDGQYTLQENSASPRVNIVALPYALYDLVYRVDVTSRRARKG